MESLDVRFRTSADVVDLDADRFFEDVLPKAFEVNGHLAVTAAAELGVDSFTFVMPSSAHTIEFAGDTFAVRAGGGGAASVKLDEPDLMGLVNDLVTPMTFLTGGTLRTPTGRLEDFLDWWVVLRAVLDERPAYSAGSVSFVAGDGTPLDLGRAFTPRDDDSEIAHFLRQAGFLHLRGWLDPDDMERIAADMDAALPTYEPDDRKSWWATTRSGDRRCVRMQRFDDHSPTTTRILDGEALTRIGVLTGDGHAMSRFGTSRVEALVKPVGVVEGISDVPWHKDCSIGMHSFMCCNLTIGISVTGADAMSGQLRVVAGSHRALIQPAFVREGLDLPIVDLPTETGDVTVHCSCTMHMAQPPVDRERRVLYTGLRMPPRDDDQVLREAAREISRVREQSYKTVSQLPSEVG